METARNAFNGLCIHGVRGAKIEKGRLRSRDCMRCDADMDMSERMEREKKGEMFTDDDGFDADFESREDMLENQHRA